MRLLDGVEFLLLIRRQDWPNLRQRAVDRGFHFLHRLLMNSGDLRFGLIKDWLNPSLLFSSQVQLIGELPEAERRTVRAPGSGVRLGRSDDKTTERDRTGSHNC